MLYERAKAVLLLFIMPVFIGVVFACLVLGGAAQAQEQEQEQEQAHQSTIQTSQEAGADRLKPFMTLHDVLSQTFRNNAQLNAARVEFKAIEERLAQAQAGWKPTILSEANIVNSDTDGGFAFSSGEVTSKSYGVNVSQPLYQGGSTFARVAAARHIISAQKEALRAQEQSVLNAAVGAYMNVMRDQSLLALHEGNKKVLARQLEATQIRFEVGELTITDVSQAEARAAEASSAVIRARANLSASAAAFENITNISPGFLSQPQNMPALPVNVDEALILAKKQNPTIVMADFTHRAAKEDVDDVYGALLPRIDVNGSWNKTFDPSPDIDQRTDRTIGLSATLPLYQGGAVRSRVRAAKHTANARSIDIVDAQRSVRVNVVSAWNAHRAAKAEIKARMAQVRAADIVQTGVQEESFLGTRTVLDSLDADQEFLDAQTSLLMARVDEVVAHYNVLTAIGAMNPDLLGFSAHIP